MSEVNYREIANSLFAIRPTAGIVPPPSATNPNFSIEDGYAVGAELLRLRMGSGYSPIGRKIGFTNKTIWPDLGMSTVIWAHVYDKTLQYAIDNAATLSLEGMAAPFIEPEIVFKLSSVPAEGIKDELGLLKNVEWVALGFEIVDCNYPDWTFKPADAIADFGLHAALIVGDPHPVTEENLPELARKLREFQVFLYKGAEKVADGLGSNVLDSPALALGWLTDTLSQQPDTTPLTAGEIITTGTLTKALPVSPGEIWSAEVAGIALPKLTISFG